MYGKSEARAGVISIAFLTFALSTGAAQSPTQYQYPRDGLVVLMNGALFNLIDHLSGTSYDGYYHNNGSVCTTPFLSGTLRILRTAETPNTIC
jgi:hypothetical protein